MRRRDVKRSAVAALLSGVMAAGALCCTAVSAAPRAGGNYHSENPSISADGRYVAFESEATNLVARDTNGSRDVFVRDLAGSRTERVSVGESGVQANGGSYDAAVSADGRFVAFASGASNLVAGDTNGRSDIFIRDRVTGTTEPVSAGTVDSRGPALSADGRIVAFVSDEGVFVHDRESGATERAAAGGRDVWPSVALSADGRIVAFSSEGVFVRDRGTAATERVASAGSGVALSSDGRVVAFTSSDLHVLAYDRLTGVTEHVSEAARQPTQDAAVSADGRYVAFLSLCCGSRLPAFDVVIHDRDTSATEIAVPAPDGSSGANGQPSLSADGRFIAYAAESSSGLSDVFVRDRSTRTTTTVSLPRGRLAQGTITAGFRHTCAVTASGGVRCWGWNSSGQLGDGSTATRWRPVDVPGLGGGVRAVAAGELHTCAVTDTGSVACWGSRPGSPDARLLPETVPGLADVTAIAAGGGFDCALTAAGSVACWGDNSTAELGDGTTLTRATPAVVVGLDAGVTAIAAGELHACALLRSGGVKCWGWNASGQLGDGTTATRATPVDVAGLSGVVAIAASFYHTCALTSAGAVECWGANEYGQLGNAATPGPFPHPTPVSVGGLPGRVVAIGVGYAHSCALLVTLKLRCWGRDVSGQLGDRTRTNSRPRPVRVSGLASGVTSFAGGNEHTCALLATGAARCWGTNGQGQLGDGTSSSRVAPTPVLGFGPRCVVPNLRRKTLVAAAVSLEMANCAVGKILHVPSRTVARGRVASVDPPVGARLPAGSKVSLRLATA